MNKTQFTAADIELYGVLSNKLLEFLLSYNFFFHSHVLVPTVHFIKAEREEKPPTTKAITIHSSGSKWAKWGRERR
jgi:hypothetical protein